MNQFQMSFQEFVVLFEPTYGWADYETAEADYFRFLKAVDGLRKEDVLIKIVGDSFYAPTSPVKEEA